MSYALLVQLQEEVVDEAAGDRASKQTFLLAKSEPNLSIITSIELDHDQATVLVPDGRRLLLPDTVDF